VHDKCQEMIVSIELLVYKLISFVWLDHLIMSASQYEESLNSCISRDKYVIQKLKRAGHGTFFWYLYNSSGTIVTIQKFNIKHTLLFMTILLGSVYIVVYTRWIVSTKLQMEQSCTIVTYVFLAKVPQRIYLSRAEQSCTIQRWVSLTFF
jgi:hypothetical protein